VLATTAALRFWSHLEAHTHSQIGVVQLSPELSSYVIRRLTLIYFSIAVKSSRPPPRLALEEMRSPFPDVFKI